MARESREKTDAEIVSEAMGHHAKHYWGLIQWMKHKKMGAGDLARVIAEGHTVACAMWKFYENNWKEEFRISEYFAQGSEARPGVGTLVESNTVDEKGLASRVEELEAELESFHNPKSLYGAARLWHVEKIQELAARVRELEEVGAFAYEMPIRKYFVELTGICVEEGHAISCLLARVAHLEAALEVLKGSV